MANLLRSTGPWMAAAVVLVAAFMFWLYRASSNLETGTATADTATVALPTVVDTAFASNPQRWANRRVAVRPLTVHERLGRAALTVNLPGRENYPLILDRALLEQEMTVVEGDNLVVAGQVFALNDSILDVWAQRGLYDRENREKLQGSQTFFLVDSLDFIFPGEEGSGQPQGQ